MSVTFLTNEDKQVIDEQISQLSEEIAALKGGTATETVVPYELLIGKNMNNNGGIYTSADSLVFPKPIEVVVGLRITAPSVEYRYSVLLFDADMVKTGYLPWIFDGSSTTLTEGAYFVVCVARIDGATATETDRTAIYDSMKLTVEDGGNQNSAEKRNDLINSCLITYGREDGSNYVFVRIPKTTIDGRNVMPKVRLTSADGSIDGAKRSALKYSRNNSYAFVINAGLFNVSVTQPLGQTIIDGVSIVNEPHPQGANNETISDTECYPLCIDANGVLSAPYPRTVDTATMIADGVVHATTGWIKIVENYEILTDEIATEIVHPGKYSSQIIGQYQNGDYVVLTCDVNGYGNTIENTTGLTYTQLAQIMVDNGVKFAYVLDGGGSAETVIGNRQLNAIYEGTTGRAIPAVIVFEAQ